MIQRLRRNFIVVAMCSLCAVLAVIVGSLNAAAYYNMTQRADRILEMLSENGGHFPEKMDFGFDGRNPDFPKGEAGFEREFWGRGKFQGISVETPYETRFFSVRLDASGEVISVDTGRVAAVESGQAAAMAKAVRAKRNEKGFYGDYRFLLCPDAQTRGSRIIFVDCSKERFSCRNLLGVSLGVSAAGVLAVLFLVLYFSKKVFLPVEESDRKQRRFITDASHELKTPLTILSANLDILEMEGQENGADGGRSYGRRTVETDAGSEYPDDMGSQSSERISSMRNQIERLRNLTEQMVTLSRLDEGEQSLAKQNFTELDLSGLVAEAAALFDPIAQAKGKVFEAQVAENVCCMGDGEKLRQMLSLLLDNAMKYSAEKGKILLKLEPAKKRTGRAKLTLWNEVDESAHVEAGAQDILFERFYRADASRSSATGGSGIGLSVVKAIVELHQGKIRAVSEDGKSILFEIII